MKKTLLLAAAALIGFSASAQKYFFAQDRNDWVINGCSQNDRRSNSDKGYAEIMDNDDTTFWHSGYAGGSHPNACPHYFIINRGDNAGSVGGFGYQPRLDGGNGFVTSYKVFVTDDISGIVTAGSSAAPGAEAITDGHASINTYMQSNTPVKEGTFNITHNVLTTHTLQQVAFDGAVSGQYVVFVITGSSSSAGANLHANCAEFYLYDYREVTDADVVAAKADLKAAAQANFAKFFKDKTPGYMPTTCDAATQYMTGTIASYIELSKSADATYEELLSATEEVKDATPSTDLTSVVDLSVADGIFKLVNANGRGYLYDAEREDGHVMVSSQTSGNYGANPADFSKEHAYWSFINVGENYYVYNVATKKFLVAPAANGANQYWTISSDAASPITIAESAAGYSKVEILGNGNIHLSVTSGYNDRTWVVSYYAREDGGVPFCFERVADANTTVDNEMTEKFNSFHAMNEAKAAANAAIAKANQYTGDGDDLRLGEGYNLYSGTTREALNALIAAANTAMEGTDVNAINAAAEALNAEVAKLTMNLPAANAFIRIRSSKVATGMRYLASHNTAHPSMSTRGNLISKEDNETATIFFFDGNSLLGYETGYYVKNNSDFAGFIANDTEAASNTPVSIEIGDATTTAIGTYFVKFNSTRYLYAKANPLTADGVETQYFHTDAGNGINTDAGYAWWLEAVNELPVVIDDNKYATFCAPVALTLPQTDADFKAYVISSKKGSQLTLTLIDDKVIAPNTPMVVYCETPGTYNFGINNEPAVVSREAAPALFAASAHTTTMPEGAYTLQVKEGTPGMYPATEGAALKGFSSYMPAAAAAGQEGYTLYADGSTTTGINEIVAEGATSKAIFDLQGRRVSKASKGIFIINGKKTLVK